MKIKYMPHPVSPEDKAKARKEGFTILDAKFAPPDEVKEKPKRKSTAKK